MYTERRDKSEEVFRLALKVAAEQPASPSTAFHQIAHPCKIGGQAGGGGGGCPVSLNNVLHRITHPRKITGQAGAPPGPRGPPPAGLSRRITHPPLNRGAGSGDAFRRGAAATKFGHSIVIH